jgi:hypothetical protein
MATAAKKVPAAASLDRTSPAVSEPASADVRKRLRNAAV